MIKTDNIAILDILDRQSLADSIARSIAHTAKQESNGFVVGITGKWGSGKSTLLGFIQEKLKAEFKKDKACFLEFNPWALSEATDLRKAFLKHFIYGIDPDAKRKSLLKNLSKWVLKLVKTIGFGYKQMADFSLDLSTLLTDYIDTDNTNYYKKLIDDALEKNNRKIFVFIDDIDRLAPAQIFALFQLLKLTGNFKNTYYLLAFDREAVEISIESQFSNYGQKFLDKIIQADFGMPEINEEKVEQLFFDQLEGLVTQMNIPLNRSELTSLWLHKGLKNYFRTIRDINRFISSLQFSLSPIANDINLLDFLVLETIRLNNYALYEHIYNEGGWAVKNYLQMQSFNFTNPTEQRMAQPLLSFLFEEVAKNGLNAKRVRDPEFFDRYFTLRIGQKDVSEKELQMFFENPNTEKILADALTYGRLKNLLIRVNDADILKHYANWDMTLVEKMFLFLDTRYYELDNYEIDFVDAIINLISVKEKDRYANFNYFLKFLLQLQNRYSVAKVHFLHFMCMDKYKDSGFSANSHAFKEFYLQNHASIEKEYIEYINKWKGYITARELTHPESPSTFYFMIDYVFYCKDEYLNRVTDFLKEDSYILFYLKKLLVFNVGDGKPYKVETTNMNRFLPDSLLNDFAHALGKMESKKLSEQQIAWREFFLPYAFEILKNKGLLRPATTNK